MPTQSNGTLGSSERVGWQTRTYNIPGVTARQDRDGNRPIIIHALQGAASGQNNTRGFRLSMIGNGITSYTTLLSNKQTATSTTATTFSHIPAVTTFTGVADTRVANPSGTFTMRYEAFLSAAESSGVTNNFLETTTPTDDLRLGRVSSTLYWGAYNYYEVPTAPTITGASFAATTATVTWNAPTSNGETAVTGYTVEYTQSSTFSSIIFTTTTTGTSLNIGVGATGTWYFRVYATNAVGNSQRSSILSAVAPAPPVWTTTAVNDTARVGSTTYSRQLSASNTSATGYSLASGTLPGGITLSTGGLLSSSAGSPVSAGVSQAFTFRVNATGNGGTTLSNTFTINRRQPLCVWTDNTLGTNLRVGTLYSDSVSASSASSYSAVGLPQNGISLQAGGVISGTPTSTSSFSFTINAANSDGDFISQSFTLTPKAALAVWTDNTLDTGTVKVNQSYTDKVSATNAVSYAIQSGALPPGIELDTVDGDIFGTPTTVGTYTFTISATNESNESIFTGSLVITVEPGGAGNVWNGSTWTQAPFKVWNGSTWTEAPAKVWDGSTWADPIV